MRDQNRNKKRKRESEKGESKDRKGQGGIGMRERKKEGERERRRDTCGFYIPFRAPSRRWFSPLRLWPAILLLPPSTQIRRRSPFVLALRNMFLMELVRIREGYGNHCRTDDCDLQPNLRIHGQVWDLVPSHFNACFHNWPTDRRTFQTPRRKTGIP